jgi:hypothetical protein
MKRFALALVALLLPSWLSAQVAISQLPAVSTPLTGAEMVPAVQSGVTKKVTASQLSAFISSGAPYVTLEQYGGAGDAKFNSSYNLTNTPTDNLPALNAILALGANPPIPQGATKVVPTIVLSPTGAYYFSALPDIHYKITILGSASSIVTSFPVGSSILFPKATGGLIFEQSDMSGRTGGPNSGDLGTSTGSIVDGVNFVGIGASSSTTAYGLQMRTAVSATNVNFFNISGDCVYIVGYSNGTQPYGEPNGFDLDAVAHDCGQNGLEIGGSDANAAHDIKFASHQTGGAGVVNYSYFANRFELGDITGYGTHGVFNNGVNYALHNPNSGGTTTPGTDRTVWWPVGPASAASSTFPQWVLNGTYTLQVPIYDSGAGSVYVAPYIETRSIGAYIAPPSMLLNGTADNAAGSAVQVATYGIESGGAVASPSGMGGARYLQSTADFGYPKIGGSSGMYAYALTGGLDNTDGQVISFSERNSRVGGDFSWKDKWNSSGDKVLQYGGNKEIRWQSGVNFGIGATSIPALAGRFSPVFNMMGLPGFLLGGSSGYGSPHRLFQILNTAPTTGQFAQGEHIFNYAPTTGGIDGWVATTTGAIATNSWTGSHAYNTGDLVTNDSGKSYVALQPPIWVANHSYSTGALFTGQTGLTYVVTTGGTSAATGLGPLAAGTGITDGTAIESSVASPTSAGSGGPTGTGTSIIDNTVLWSYGAPYVLTPDYLNERASPSTGIGYVTGAGGAVTQITSRTTGVTLNKVTGAITLVSAAGSATPFSFTVTDSAVAATDTISLSEKSGTDLYELFVTAVAAGSFQVTAFTTGGTTTEQPVINFNVVKGAAS